LGVGPPGRIVGSPLPSPVTTGVGAGDGSAVEGGGVGTLKGADVGLCSQVGALVGTWSGDPCSVNPGVGSGVSLKVP
jgi:hypothetical protein